MDNYNVFILGPSGSGKTIFLASLFKVFSIQQAKYGFFLEVEDNKNRQALNKIYETLITEKEWPPGTRNISTWTFNCCLKERNLSTNKICKLTYRDYSGGIVTDIDSNDINLKSEIKQADAVLALIDGQKMLSLMQHKDMILENNLETWLHTDLPTIMQLVDYYCKRDTPVHFIITKWDLLEKNYSLSQIKKELSAKVTEFRNLVVNRKNAGCTVTLIPVSSIGKNFANIQNDGKMEKIPGAIPQPEWVEVPLAFVLTHKLKSQTNNQSSKSPENFHKNAQDKFKLSNLSIVIDFFVSISIITLLSYLQLGGLVIPTIVIYAIIRFLMKRINNPKKKVLKSCRSIQKKFFARFRDANL